MRAKIRARAAVAKCGSNTFDEAVSLEWRHSLTEVQKKKKNQKLLEKKVS